MLPNSTHDKNRIKSINEGQQVTEVTQDTTTQEVANIAVVNDERIRGKFGRYEIIQVIGKGGMGEVYLANDTVLDRNVAIKFPKFRGPDISVQRERFRREARAAAGLRHAGLCPVYDVGEDQGIDFLTMAYVEGPTLAELLKQHGPLPSHLAAQIIQQVASAMSFAHEHGFVHRDLKPTNIIWDVESKIATVLDFGLAKRITDPQLLKDTEHEEPLTQEGAIVGTPAYMPLEQVTGDVTRIGPASDIYSLGLILFELLTGRRVFRNSQEILQSAVRGDKLPSLLSIQPAIESGLEAIYQRACAKLPEDRFSSMAEFASALQPFSQSKKAGRSRWFYPVLITGAAAAVLLLGVIIFTFTTREGSVRVEISDPKAPVEIKLDGEAIQLTLDGKPLKVKPGKHQFTVTGNGFETTTTEFTAKAGELATVKLTVQPLPAAGAAAPQPKMDLEKEIARLTILLEEAQLKKDVPGVIRYASEILLHQPDHQDALVYRGIVRFEQKEWDKALNDFNQCLHLNSRNTKALFQRSQIKYKTGQINDALSDLDSLIKLEPESSTAKLQKCWLIGSLGDHNQALSLCSQVITSFPKLAEAYWKRASIQYARGDYPAALEDMKAAENLDNSYRGRFPDTLPDPPDWTLGDSVAPVLQIIKYWQTPNKQFIHHVSINADGTKAAVSTDGNAFHLFVFDYHKGTIVYDQPLQTQSKLLFQDQQQLIYTQQKGPNEIRNEIKSRVFRVDVTTGETESLFHTANDGYLHALSLSKDNKSLFISGNIKPHIWDFESRKLKRIINDAEGVIEGSAFTNDNRHVITAAWNDIQKPVRLWDIANGNEIREFKGHVGGSIHLSMSGKRDRLLTCGLRDRTARLWDVESGRELKVLRHPTGVVRVALSHDGRYALTISGWRHNPDGSTNALGYSNPFPKIWPNQHDNILRLWDLDTGRVIGRFNGELKNLYSLAFSPDGEQAVLCLERSIAYLDIAGAIKKAASKVVK